MHVAIEVPSTAGVDAATRLVAVVVAAGTVSVAETTASLEVGITSAGRSIDWTCTPSGMPPLPLVVASACGEFVESVVVAYATLVILKSAVVNASLIRVASVGTEGCVRMSLVGVDVPGGGITSGSGSVGGFADTGTGAVSIGMGGKPGMIGAVDVEVVASEVLGICVGVDVASMGDTISTVETGLVGLAGARAGASPISIAAALE